MIKQLVSLGMVGVMVLSAIVLSLSPLTYATPKVPVVDEEPEVTICHATSSATNPYTSNEVAVSAVDGVGNGDHYLVHTGPIATSEEVAEYIKNVLKVDWGDIIPPIEGVHDGLNWTEAGQAIWANGCTYVEEEEEIAVASVTYRIVPANCEAPASLFYSFQNAFLGEQIAIDVIDGDLFLAEVVSETEIVGPASVELLFIAEEGAEFEGGASTFFLNEELEGQLTGDQCVLGENPEEPETPVTPETPEVLPETNGSTAAVVASIIAGVTALIALMGTSVRSLFGRAL